MIGLNLPYSVLSTKQLGPLINCVLLFAAVMYSPVVYCTAQLCSPQIWFAPCIALQRPQVVCFEKEIRDIDFGRQCGYLSHCLTILELYHLYYFT